MNEVKYTGVNSPLFHIHKFVTYDPNGQPAGEVYGLYINYEYQNSYASLDDCLNRVRLIIENLGRLPNGKTQ